MIGVMVAVVLILILAVVLLKGGSVFGMGKSAGPERADKKGTTVLGKTRYAAQDGVCRSNLGQVRSSIQIVQSTNDDKPPESIEETKLGSDFYKCPLGGEPYVYDPSTGKVHCPHPGHESY